MCKNISMENNFGTWLNDELNDRDWNQNQLAKKAGLASGTISNIINGSKGIGSDTALAIAQALHIPPKIVFEAAGLLPKSNKPHRIQDEIIAYKTRELTDSQADEVIDYIELIKKKDERQRQTELEKSHTNETREVKAPPERLKKAKIIDYLKK